MKVEVKHVTGAEVGVARKEKRHIVHSRVLLSL